MNSLPQITVILPTYNRRNFLPSAIKCIADQNFKAWRLLVLNDGGEDVGDIVKKFNDPRIEYIDLPHQGKPATVNHALQLVKSKYIAYMDDDDEVFPEHLELLFEAAELNNSAFVYSDTYLTVLDENGNVVSKTIENDTDVIYEDIRFYNRINHKQILHTKELADKVGLYDDRMSILIDYDYIKRLAKLETPYHVHEITGNHYLRGNCHCQISGMWTKSPQKTGESLLAFFEKDPEGLSQVYQNNMHVKIENDTLKSSLADKNAENDSLKMHFKAINGELPAIKASIAFKLGTLLAKPKKLQQLKSV